MLCVGMLQGYQHCLISLIKGLSSQHKCCATMFMAQGAHACCHPSLCLCMCGAGLMPSARP